MGTAGDTIFGGLMGAIGGVANSKQKQIEADIDEQRKRSYAQLMQQYQQDNMRLQNELSTQRDKSQWAHDDSREEKKWSRDDKLLADSISREDANHLRDRAEGREDYLWQLQTGQKYKDTRGNVGREYDDLVRIYGEEEAKNILRSGSQRGGFSQEDIVKLRTEAVKQATKLHENDLALAQTEEERNNVNKSIYSDAEEIYNIYMNQQQPSANNRNNSTAGFINSILSSNTDVKNNNAIEEPLPISTEKKPQVINSRTIPQQDKTKYKSLSDVKVPTGSYQQYLDQQQGTPVTSKDVNTPIFELLQKKLQGNK